MRTPVELRFEKGDPVREYWLSHGEGFAVENRRGRMVGQVVDVVVDPAQQRVTSLVVQKSRGVAELPADEIQAVVPAREMFVVDGAGRERRAEQRREPRAARYATAALRAVALWVAGVARVLAGELRRRAE